MARRKSIKKVAKDFQENAEAIKNFASSATQLMSKSHASWAYDYAIIRLYRDFEDLILNALKGAINNDPSTISSVAGFDFPKTLSDAVCEYLIVGAGYFDFKGRDGLIKTVKNFVPTTHYLVTAIKRDKYKDALEKLSALRNYAAHDSKVSASTAKKVAGVRRMASAGAWLKSQQRFEAIADKLKELAKEIEIAAPY